MISVNIVSGSAKANVDSSSAKANVEPGTAKVSVWGAWEACSVSCEGATGVQARRRKCLEEHCFHTVQTRPCERQQSCVAGQLHT